MRWRVGAAVLAVSGLAACQATPSKYDNYRSDLKHGEAKIEPLPKRDVDQVANLLCSHKASDASSGMDLLTMPAESDPAFHAAGLWQAGMIMRGYCKDYTVAYFNVVRYAADHYGKASVYEIPH